MANQAFPAEVVMRATPETQGSKPGRGHALFQNWEKPFPLLGFYFIIWQPTLAGWTLGLPQLTPLYLCLSPILALVPCKQSKYEAQSTSFLISCQVPCSAVFQTHSSLIGLLRPSCFNCLQGSSFSISQVPHSPDGPWWICPQRLLLELCYKALSSWKYHLPPKARIKHLSAHGVVLISVSSESHCHGLCPLG